MDSKVKSGGIPVLVDRYTAGMKEFVRTGKGKPDPQSFMDKCPKGQKDELQFQLNMTTLLTLYGREQYQQAQKTLKKGNFLEKSRQRFFDKLKKSSGAQ
jgi:hypothetical protein